MGAIASILSAIAPKLFDIVDKTVEDKDAALKIKAEISSQILNNSSDLAKAASGVVIAEAKGESWLQRNWRPMLMVWFAILIGAYWFGFVPPNLDQNIIASLFDLVKIGVGGYVVGRSVEKTAGIVAPMLNQ
ncbi:MAG: hypothetical protein IE937_01170, partial [Gammaproteobacteria bacterium]|nr:hypothetical protein [Gammaproteobacteria bacterium]